MSPVVGGPGINELLPDGPGSVADDRYSSASLPRDNLVGVRGAGSGSARAGAGGRGVSPSQQ